MLGVEDGGMVNGVLAGFVVRVGVVAVAEVARVVVVQQVVVARLAARIDGVAATAGIRDRSDAGLVGIGAVAVGAAAEDRQPLPERVQHDG